MKGAWILTQSLGVFPDFLCPSGKFNFIPRILELLLLFPAPRTGIRSHCRGCSSWKILEEFRECFIPSRWVLVPFQDFFWGIFHVVSVPSRAGQIAQGGISPWISRDKPILVFPPFLPGTEGFPGFSKGFFYLPRGVGMQFHPWNGDGNSLGMQG